MPGLRTLTSTASLLTLAAGCGSAPPSLQPDAGGGSPDAGASDIQILPDQPTCGPGSYPCGPYGTLTNDIIENLNFLGYKDRNGNKLLDTKVPGSKDYAPVPLREYYLSKDKKLLWIIVSAVWCSVCKSENKELAQIYKKGQLDPRVELYQVMFEDENYLPMNKKKLEEWIDAFGNPGFAYYAGTPLTFPNVMDPSFKMGRYFDRAATPLNVLVDLTTMKIVYAKTGYSLQSIAAVIKQALANIK